MAHVSSGASHHFGGGGHYKAIIKSISFYLFDENDKISISKDWFEMIVELSEPPCSTSTSIYGVSELACI